MLECGVGVGVDILDINCVIGGSDRMWVFYCKFSLLDYFL